MKNSIFIFVCISCVLTAFKPLNNTYSLSKTKLYTKEYKKIKHPLYITLCQITQNPQTKTTEIAIKIFTDDLEKAVSGYHNNQALHLNSSKEIAQSNDWVENYLLKCFKMSINNAVIPIKFVGKEYENDGATWCYLETNATASIKNITITNTILTEIYAKQNNIVQITVNKVRKSLLLTKDNTSDSLVF
jgi:hypothetical protein